MNRIKQEKKIKKIILNREKYRDQGDRTIKVRENFVNMVLRNNHVAPLVHNSKYFVQFSYFYNIFYIISIFLFYMHFLQARKYSLKEKMFCIRIYHRSCSYYNYISKFLLYPSNTLNTKLKCIPYSIILDIILSKIRIQIFTYIY